MISFSTHAVCFDLPNKIKFPLKPTPKPILELPPDPEQLIALGEKCLRGRLIIEAKRCFEQVLALDQNSSEAHYWLGCLYNRQGNYERAAVELRNCLAAQPRNGHAYAELGLVYFKQGHIREARAFWQQGLLLSAGNTPVLAKLLEQMSFYVIIDGEKKVIHNLCSMATLAAEIEIACNYLERAYLLEPYNPIVFQALATVLAANKRSDDAGLAWEEAIRLCPQDSYTLARAAAYYLKENQVEKAKSRAEKAVELAPDNASHRLLLARILKKLHNIKEAEINLRIAHKLAPEEAAVNFELGQLLWSEGNSPTGLVFLIKAVRAGSDEARQLLSTNNRLR